MLIMKVLANLNSSCSTQEKQIVILKYIVGIGINTLKWQTTVIIQELPMIIGKGHTPCINSIAV